jgi:hypothetical protein
MHAGLRRLLTWIVVLFGALLVLVGVIDLAVGPESEALETGVELAETASRWTGLIYIALGAAIIALSIRVDRAVKNLAKKG